MVKKKINLRLLLIVLSVVLLGTSTVFAEDSDYDELFNFGTDDSTTTTTQEPTTTDPTTTTEPTTTTTALSFDIGVVLISSKIKVSS